MPKKLQVNVSILRHYQFEMEVLDDYDQDEAYIIAGSHFEENEKLHESWLIEGDFQVDNVKEVTS